MSKLNFWAAWSLTVKLTISVTALFAVMVVGLTWLFIYPEQNFFELAKARASITPHSLLIAFYVGLTGALIAVLLNQIVTRPLKQLADATERLAAGDLSQPVPIPAGGELAALARSLEKMRLDFQGLYQDLAEQIQTAKENEGRFRRVITSIGDHVYMTEVNPQGERVNGYISPNVEELTGYSAETFLADWNFWPTQLIYPDDRPAAAAQAARMAQGYNSEMEYRLTKPDGDIIWVRDNGRVERDPETQNLIVYGVVSDITERKHAEYLLAQARDQALEVSRLKTRLLANVSHELRTPLGAILGYTEMLSEGVFGPLNERQHHTTREIIDSIGQLLEFVNNLLNQAQIESGKVVLRTQPFYPTDLLEHLKSTASVLTKAKDLQLICTIDPQIPSILYGDPYWLRQILINLVGNAIKFTEEGTIEVQLYRPNDTTWAIRVADTGAGIAPEAQSYIFEAFRQVDGTLTRAHGGSGLGLSIVKHVTTLMKGQITLTSEVGQGSVFTISLPLTSIEEKVK